MSNSEREIDRFLEQPEHYRQAQRFVSLAKERIVPLDEQTIVKIELEDTNYYLDMVDRDIGDVDPETANWLRITADYADIRSAVCTDVCVNFRSNSKEAIEDLKKELVDIRKDFNAFMEGGSIKEQDKFSDFETPNNPEGYLFGLRYSSLVFLTFEDPEE